MFANFWKRRKQMMNLYIQTKVDRNLSLQHLNRFFWVEKNLNKRKLNQTKTFEVSDWFQLSLRKAQKKVVLQNSTQISWTVCLPPDPQAVCEEKLHLQQKASLQLHALKEKNVEKKNGTLQGTNISPHPCQGTFDSIVLVLPLSGICYTLLEGIQTSNRI